MFGLSTLYIRLIGIAAIVVAALGLYTYIGHLKSENERLVLSNNVLTLKISDQNDAITALKKSSDLRLAAAQKDLDEAKAQSLAASTKAKVIYKTIPSQGTATCAADRQSTLDLFNRASK